MTAIQFLMRVLMVTLRSPLVSDVLTEVARHAVNVGGKRLIAEVENGMGRFERKSSPKTIR